MTTIKATCPVCGEVELTPEQVRLVVCSVRSRSFYAFGCPSCLEEIRKPADERIVSLLMSGGVIVSRWDIPAEALEDRAGPTLTYDDLLDFVLRLQTTAHLAAFARSPQTA